MADPDLTEAEEVQGTHGDRSGEVAVDHVRISRFRAALPLLPHCLAYTCFLLNLIPSGWGTLLAALLSLCYPSAQLFSSTEALCINFGVFFLQLILTPFLLVGWVWSVMWGCALVAIADSQRLADQEESPLSDG